MAPLSVLSCPDLVPPERRGADPDGLVPGDLHRPAGGVPQGDPAGRPGDLGQARLLAGGVAVAAAVAVADDGDVRGHDGLSGGRAGLAGVHAAVAREQV